MALADTQAARARASVMMVGPLLRLSPFDLDQCGNGHPMPNSSPTALEDEMVDANAMHDKQVRLRGRRMWREAGSPKGREDEYIELARELQAFREHPKAGLLPNPMMAHPEPSATEEPVEEAELLENLGEFPGWTDQGDRMQAPVTKRKVRILPPPN
jgi:hypothetical protein